MEVLIIGVVLIIVLGAIGYLVVRARKLPPTKRSMKQFARKPTEMLRRGQVFSQRDALLSRAGDLSDGEITAGVQAILAGAADERNTWTLVLEKVGPRAWPLVLTALDDPRADPAIKPEGTSQNYAFEALMRILSRTGCDAVIPRLTPLLAGEDADNRKLAAMHILATGSAAAIEPALRALHHPQEEVRSYAYIGCCRTHGGAPVSDAFRAALRAALEPICAGETHFNAFADMRAAETLVKLDQSAAVRHLTSPRCLRVDNSHLSHVLQTLNKASIPVPPSVAKAIYDHAATQSEGPWPIIRSQSMQALAAVDASAAEPLVMRSLDSDDATERIGAAEALLKLHALPGPFSFFGTEDIQSLPRPVQHVAAVIDFEGEVNNGGVSQYYFNSAGNNWPLALEAFRAMNCPNCADILEQSTKVLGPAGPSLSREKRIKQYAKLSDEIEKQLDDLSSRFYDDEDGLQARIARYMVANAAVFRAAGTPVG